MRKVDGDAARRGQPSGGCDDDARGAPRVQGQRPGQVHLVDSTLTHRTYFHPQSIRGTLELRCGFVMTSGMVEAAQRERVGEYAAEQFNVKLLR